jgi:hypothetical protein
MVRKSRQHRDEILEDLHNQYMDDLTNSELPESIASMYGFSPLSISFSEEGDTPPPGQEENPPAETKKKSK